MATAPKSVSKRRGQTEAEIAKKLRGDLAFVAENVIGEKLSNDQKDILHALSKPGARVAVRTCHGIGKTFAAAVAVCSFLPTFPNSIVLTSAPTLPQVRDLLWKEIKAIHARSLTPLGGQCLMVRWDIAPGWFAVGMSTNRAERMQGRHAEHILVVFDEAPGIDPQIWIAGLALMTGRDARFLAIGNPTMATGDFADCFKNPRWEKFKIDWTRAPNVTGEMEIPGGCTEDWVDEMRERFGEESPVFITRCLAEFPPDDKNAIIPWSWIAQAQDRDVGAFEDIIRAAKPVLAVDVARYGDDRTVFLVRQGPKIHYIETVAKRDTMETAGRAVQLTKEYGIDPEQVKVDDTGVGGGVVDRLNEVLAPRRVTPVIFGAKARDETSNFGNWKTELYWALRGALNPRQKAPLCLPRDENLANDLTQRYKITSTGKMMVEEKDTFKKRRGRSPDHGDALAISLAVPIPVPADAMKPWGDDAQARRDRDGVSLEFGADEEELGDE